jgi:AcrR family transcriptional regulator
VEDRIATATAASAARPLRADAMRNRARILAAASDVFAESGVDGSLEEIARRGGVGVGTLYRHFPNRAALVEMVYRDGVDELCATATDLLQRMAPVEALEEWVLGFVAYVGRKRGTAAALRAAVGEESATIFADAHDQLEGAARLLLTAAQADGAVRTDVQPMDMLRAVSGVCMSSAEATNPDQTRRLLRLVLDGLRYGASG